jgi:hypothetical protein
MRPERFEEQKMDKEPKMDKEQKMHKEHESARLLWQELTKQFRMEDMGGNPEG